jgi:hypothetical protein
LTLLKSIVVCLVLANVGYFLWAHGVAGTAETPAQPAPEATLKLASESPRGANAGAGGASADGGSAGGLSGGTAMGSAGAAAGGLSGGAAGGTAAGGQLGGAVAAGSAAAGLSGGRAAGGTAPGTLSNGGAAGGAAAGNAEAGLLTNVKRCISIGPFNDVSEAAHAATTLRGGGYDPRQRSADGDVWAGVWVYLPLPPTKAAGDQMLAKLKAAGIDDALEMPGPNEGSVISLGLYGESKRAQARVAQVQALGFNPGIADRKRSGNVYWIDIDLKPTDSLLNPADLQGESGRIVRLEVKACPPAAGSAP